MDIELKQVNIGSIVKFKDEDRAILVNNFDYNEFTKNLTLIGYYEAKNDHLYDKLKLYHVDNIILPNGEKEVYNKDFDLSFNVFKGANVNNVELLGFVDKSVLVDIINKEYKIEFEKRDRFIKEFIHRNCLYTPKIGEVYNLPRVGAHWIFIVTKVENGPSNINKEVSGFEYNYDSGLFDYKSLPLTIFQYIDIKDRLIYTIPNAEYLSSFNYSPYTRAKSFKLNGEPSILPKDLVDKINNIISTDI